MGLPLTLVITPLVQVKRCVACLDFDSVHCLQQGKGCEQSSRTATCTHLALRK